MKKFVIKIVIICMIVSICAGISTLTGAQEINNPPIAQFSWISNDLEVNFTDESTDTNGTIVSWLWIFGDGNTSTLQNVTHTYENEGVYPVNLTVTDDGGLINSTQQNISVSISTQPLTVNVTIHPRTLNFKSKGKWITCYIELSDGYNVSEINISSLRLNGEIPAEPAPTEIGDNDNDGLPDLMVKFSRSEVIEILDRENESEIVITGELNDGTSFSSSDTIRTLNKINNDSNSGKMKSQNHANINWLNQLIRKLLKINPNLEVLQQILDLLE